MKTLVIALKTIIYATLFLLFFAYLALHVRVFDVRLPVQFPSGAGILGAVFMVAGGILGFLCVATFVIRGEGTPALFDAPKKFVATGPYRYCRNPMYVGGLALLAGLGLYERSVSILMMAVVLFGVVNLLVMLHEEPRLRRNFGDSYTQYCREVHRWLPTRRTPQ